MIIVPTIGRVVWVYRGVSDQAEPAFITYVHNPRMVNVAGFSCNGEPFALNSTQLLQDDDTPLVADRCARWMPYQQAQASRHSSETKE